MNKLDLSGFTGTLNYYQHWTGFKYTDGVSYLADKGECYWLLDVIGSYQSEMKKCPFQLWKLKVNKDSSTIITMQEDTDTKILVKQEFDFTTFPLEEIKLYLIDGVLLLPSEY